MKERVERSLSYGLPAVRKKLIRSKSCTVMQSSLLGEDNSVVFDRSTSIDNEESLLDNLEYFVSENFIKDLIDHQF
jgi:hypothetical protein